MRNDAKKFHLAFSLSSGIPITSGNEGEGLSSVERNAKPQAAFAFTLIEMVLALGILGILLVAGQSAIRLAGHSVPSSSSPNYSAGNGQRALAQLSSELAYAQSITAMSATSITFTVAARGSDSSPETICYSWDGVTGDPLTRQYNSDAAVNLVSNVNSFSLLYDKKAVTAATTYNTSAPTTLYSYDNSSFLTSATGLASTEWLSQSFSPNIPANATSWKVTSVKIKASQDVAPGGSFYVQIRPSFGGIPSTAVLQQTTVNGSSLPGSAGWYTVNFASPVTISAGVQGALTLQFVSQASYPLLSLLGIQIGTQYCPPADIVCQISGATGLPIAYTTNSGTSWSNVSNAAMYCYVMGTYTSPNASSTNYYLENVRASLQLGSNGDSAVRTGINVLNLPQVTGP